MIKTNEQLAMQVSRNSIIANLLLSGFKMFAGITSHSIAMISDAVHSLSDVLSTVIVIIGFKMSNCQSDKEHPYGHERLECVAAILLAAILFATGVGIGWAGVGKIISGSYGRTALPGLLALIAALISILTKEAMFWYTRSAARRIDSGALMADAWHHRLDALSSAGSFLGILGARLGLPILDPLACLVICLLILKAAVSIFIDAVSKMTDRACEDIIVEEMEKVILAQPEVIKVDQIKTRLFGNKFYVDVEIGANGELPLFAAHHIAQQVHDDIEQHFPRVKHCMVHVNPVLLTAEYQSLAASIPDA